MLKNVLRKAISCVLVFAMFCEISTPLAYAAGNSLKTRSSLDPSLIERSYDPYKQPKGESADITLDKEVADVVNNITNGGVLEASNETVLFENITKRDVNAKAYRLTDGSDSVLLYPVSVHEKDAEGKEDRSH